MVIVTMLYSSSVWYGNRNTHSYHSSIS